MRSSRTGRARWHGGGEGARGPLAVRAGPRPVLERAGRVQSAARVSARLAEIDFREGRPAEAVARLEQALGTLAAHEQGEDLATISGELGRFLVLNGQLEEAAPHLERALELAEALDLDEVFAEALTSKAMLLTYRNRLTESGILLEGAIARGARERPACARAEGVQQPRRRARVVRPIRRRIRRPGSQPRPGASQR